MTPIYTGAHCLTNEESYSADFYRYDAVMISYDGLRRKLT